MCVFAGAQPVPDGHTVGEGWREGQGTIPAHPGGLPLPPAHSPHCVQLLPSAHTTGEAEGGCPLLAEEA